MNIIYLSNGATMRIEAKDGDKYMFNIVKNSDTVYMDISAADLTKIANTILEQMELDVEVATETAFVLS